MTYAIEEIIDTLKRARAAKGLSQRALGARTGVPQSHISKIESGNADIRLSSLIEIARALDLELELVPRRTVPAVESLVRASAPKAATSTATARDITRTVEAIRHLRAQYPELEALPQLQSSLHSLRVLQETSENVKRLRELTRPVHDLAKLTAVAREAGRTAARAVEALPQENLHALAEAARAAQHWRNEAAHRHSDARPRPAYQLDDEGGADG